MKRDYVKQYGKTQEELYKTLIILGYSERKIQELYKIPQASLRRCRHKWNSLKSIA